MKIDVLGTKYVIFEKSKSEDSFLNDCDGYCDKTSKKIVVTKEPPDNELQEFEVYRKKVLRHEIIHAFLYESGLQENFEHSQWGHDETTIDWFAIQFPKILQTFKKVGCI